MPAFMSFMIWFQEVTCLDFHPREPILASGSKDFSVKLFDYSKASAKKATKTLTDSEQINSISFHPSGITVSSYFGPIQNSIKPYLKSWVPQWRYLRMLK